MLTLAALQNNPAHQATFSGHYPVGAVLWVFLPGVICSSNNPGSVPKFRPIPEPRPLTEKDLPDLASINPHDSGIWVIWTSIDLVANCGYSGVSISDVTAWLLGHAS
jgi:hypothetical protein